MQLSSDITSKIRIVSKIIFGCYILRKPFLRQKMRILKQSFGNTPFRVIRLSENSTLNFDCEKKSDNDKTNKTGTSQFGAISKAQKAQNIFLEKTSNFRKKILSENVAQCQKL